MKINLAIVLAATVFTAPAFAQGEGDLPSARVQVLAECVAFYNASAEYGSKTGNAGAAIGFQEKSKAYTAAATAISAKMPEVADKGKYIGDMVAEKQPVFAGLLSNPSSVGIVKSQTQICNGVKLSS